MPASKSLRQPEVKVLRISELKAWKKNPRKGHAVDAISKSIERFGYLVPIVVQKKTRRVLAGHGRLEALAKSGADRVSVVLADLTDAEAQRFAILDNAIPGQSEWDFERLAELLKGMEGETGDILELLQAEDRKALRGLMADTLPPDEIPPLPADPISKVGDVWKLRNHRVACGDCLDSAIRVRILDGKTPDMMLTDPPYGMSKDIENDKPKDLEALFRGVLSSLPFSTGPVIAFQSPRLFHLWIAASLAAGHNFHRALWWYEPFSPAAGTRAYPWRGWYMQGEIILITSLGETRWPDAVDYHADTYLHEFGSPTVSEQGSVKEMWHPTVKPLWIVEDLLQHLEGGIVYEPFLGSGTTLIAAERLRRSCKAVELDPRYVDVAVKRWQMMTGEVAENLSRPKARIE